MADINYFNRFYESFKNEYDIFFVYILQAHSNDWKVGKFSHIDQPVLLEDRRQLALKFIKDFNLTIPIYLDSMDNTFNERFGAWPHRSYVIDEKNNLIYIENVIAVDYKTITTKLIEFLTE